MKDQNNRVVRPEYLRRIDRREFLQIAASGALAASGVFGCGGGGGGGGGGTTITPDQRSASIQAVLDFVNNNVNEPRDTRMTRALNFVKSRKEIIGSGRNSDGVWAIYPDGFPLMILDNRQPEPAARSALGPMPPRTRGTDVPQSRRARFIFTLGTAFSSEVPTFAPLADAHGYSSVSDEGSIESLQLVSGDGIFYMGAHGGECILPNLDAGGNVMIDSNGQGTGHPTYGIWTSSAYDPTKPNQYKAEIIAGQVGVGIMPHNKVGGVTQNASHYWITSQFVLDYMQFGDNSLVWFGACWSNSALSAAFAAACKTKKAGLYVGWSNTVGDGPILASGKFILDRLLGDNTTNPKENPPQRPFDYVKVWDDLHIHGLHLHPTDGGTTEIKYSAGPGKIGPLAPSIDYVLINEHDDQAVLYGIFGQPAPGERVVMIGGQPTGIVSWDETQIVCDLERTGTGSAGDVQVIVREHKSNIRRITEWVVPLQYSFRHPDHTDVKVAGMIAARFRADIGEYREKPHVDPIKPVRGAIATQDSGVDLMGEGQYTEADCTTYWENQQSFPAVGYAASPHHLTARFKVDTDAGTGALGLGLGSPDTPFNMRTVCPDGTSNSPFMVAIGLLFSTQFFPDPDPNSVRPAVPLPAIEITFGPNYRIPAGVFEEIRADGVIRIEWTAVNANFPPDPTAARSATVKGDESRSYRPISKRKQ